MKKFFLVILTVALIAIVALPSVGYSGHGGYYGGHYYNNHYNNNWVPAAIGGFLFGTLVGSAIAPPVYYAPPPPPPPRVYYYYPPPRPRVYVYPYWGNRKSSAKVFEAGVKGSSVNSIGQGAYCSIADNKITWNFVKVTHPPAEPGAYPI
jgi:hypothetical protein